MVWVRVRSISNLLQLYNKSSRLQITHTTSLSQHHTHKRPSIDRGPAISLTSQPCSGRKSMGQTSSCYASSTCNGTPAISSVQEDFSICGSSCSAQAYFIFNASITSDTYCFCYEFDQCTSAVYLANQPDSILYVGNDFVSNSCQPCALGFPED